MSTQELKVTINNKVWTKQAIIDLLNTNNIAVCRAIKLLYSFQTEEEKSSTDTTILNGKGFNRNDAPILSSFAQKLEIGEGLTISQIRVARPMLGKYARQILSYMKDRETSKIWYNVNTKHKEKHCGTTRLHTIEKELW